MACEKLATCIFFNDQMAGMPAVAKLLKDQYCLGAFADCARFRVASRLGGASVPKDLFPSDVARADALLASVP